MDPPRSKGQAFTAGLILAGSVLLLYATTWGWYFTQVANGVNDAGETLSLTGVQALGDAGGTVYNTSTTFSAVWLPHTGDLYLAVAGVVVGGALVGLLAGAFLLSGRGRARRRMTSGLLVVAVVLAASGPLVLLAAQPAVVCSDSSNIPTLSEPSVYGNSTPSESCEWAVPLWLGGNSAYGTFSSSSDGPQSSFFGSTPFEAHGSQGYSHVWGPTVGWYLAVVSAVLLLLGALRYRSRRGGPPDSLPTSETASPTPSTSSRVR